MSTHFHMNGFTHRLALKQRHENLRLGIHAFPISWDPYFMLVPNNLIPRFCLPMACSLKGIIVFFSLYIVIYSKMDVACTRSRLLVIVMKVLWNIFDIFIVV